MAIRFYKNLETGEIKQSLKKLNPKEYKEVKQPPNSKFMECANLSTGRSKLKDQKAILTERARNHSRDHELDDVIAHNRANDIDERSIRAAFLDEDGKARKKISDL